VFKSKDIYLSAKALFQGDKGFCSLDTCDGLNFFVENLAKMIGVAT
jgi:hypothetical protein